MIHKLLPLTILLILLISCGPAAVPPPPSPIDEVSEIDTVTAEIPITNTVETESETNTNIPTYRTLGDPNAPIKMIEYTDFQCPFCKRYADETLPRVITEYIDSGRLYYEMRDFPIASLHPLAYRLHEAVNCAGAADPAAFWDAHHLFFDNVDAFKQDSIEAMDGAILTQFAENGLPDITDCLASDQFAEIVRENIALGEADGVTGTPSFMLNGYSIVGAQPFQTFAGYIDAAENGTLAEAFATPEPPEVTMPQPAALTIRPETAMGDPNAPVQIVEFSDYQCPFCRRHALETVPQMQEMIDAGRVYYVFKDFPIPSLHPLAHRLHEATLCVRNESGANGFWQTHHLFFDQAEQFQLDDETALEAKIMQALTELGVLSDTVQTCIVERETADEVKANFDEGQRFGISATPSFFINGYQILRGAQPMATFEQVIGFAEAGELENEIMKQLQRQQQAAQAEQAAQATAQAEAAIPKDVPIGGAEPVKGAADAPITIVEYSSYQCPFCKRHFDETMPQIQTYIDDGTVRYLFKDYPLPSQPQAFKVHEATRCAKEQGGDAMYWAAHDIAFTEQATWARQPMGAHIDTIKQLFHVIDGLDSTMFDECLDSDKYVDAVQAELNEGTALGVRGTPAFFVNGKFVNGAQPFAVFQQVIEVELQAE